MFDARRSDATSHSHGAGAFRTLGSAMRPWTRTPFLAAMVMASCAVVSSDSAVMSTLATTSTSREATELAAVPPAMAQNVMALRFAASIHMTALGVLGSRIAMR